MSCAKFHAQGALWRAGTLEPSLAEELAAHLRDCWSCTRNIVGETLTCRALVAFLCDYLEGSLAPAQRALMEVHLDRCPACERYVSSYRATIALARAAHLCTAPPMPAKLVRTIVAMRAEIGPP